MNNNENIRPDQTGGMEIERTPEMIEKWLPALGTRDAGQEGKDYVGHDDEKANKGSGEEKKLQENDQFRSDEATRSSAGSDSRK